MGMHGIIDRDATRRKYCEISTARLDYDVITNRELWKPGWETTGNTQQARDSETEAGVHAQAKQGISNQELSLCDAFSSARIGMHNGVRPFEPFTPLRPSTEKDATRSRRPR